MLDLYHHRKVRGLNGGYLLLLITLTLISTTSCTVNVTYLRGVPRLSNTSYWDYYFFCRTTGRTLLWEVNSIVLNGFQGGNVVGQVLSGTTPNYTYIATVLSLKPTTDLQFTFDSVLIVSVPGMSSLEVLCSDGPSSNRTSNVNNGKGVESSTFTSSIFEEYLLTEDIVGDKSSQTSIFICGVHNRFMYWRGATDIELGFSVFDNIGQERRILESDATTVTEQAIVIAEEPYQIVSVFFATATSDVTVTCGYDNQNKLDLTSRFDSNTSVTQVQTDPEIVSSTTLGTFTGGGTEITTSNSSTSLYIVIGVVIPVVLAMCTVMVACIVYCVKKRVRVQKEPHSDHPSEESDEAVPPINQHQQPQQPQEIPLEDRLQDNATKSQGFTRGGSTMSNMSKVSAPLQKVKDPSNLIDGHPSYHGELTSVEAMERLNIEGGRCYLVRYSMTKDHYVLSVRHTKGTGASHFTLVVQNKKFWLDHEGGKKEFESLDHLLNHYKEHSLTEKISKIGEECKSAEFCETLI